METKITLYAVTVRNYLDDSAEMKYFVSIDKPDPEYIKAVLNLPNEYHYTNGECTPIQIITLPYTEQEFITINEALKNLKNPLI